MHGELLEAGGPGGNTGMEVLRKSTLSRITCGALATLSLVTSTE